MPPRATSNNGGKQRGVRSAPRKKIGARLSQQAPLLGAAAPGAVAAAADIRGDGTKHATTTTTTATTAQAAVAGAPVLRTWPEIVVDPHSRRNTRLRAENAVADRMAYFAKMHSLLSLYMRHCGVWQREQRQQTWKYHIDTLYAGMLRRQRLRINEMAATRQATPHAQSGAAGALAAAAEHGDGRANERDDL